LEADARRQRPGETIEADLCIVGAGPAGLSLAHALLGSGLQGVVLESGGRDFDRVAQALNEAQVVGSAYGDLLQTRQRQVGGTANAWNSEVDGEVAAKFVPLDPIDFVERAEVPLGGWPFGREELDRWYEQAHALCAIGPFDYRADAWRSEGREPLRLDGALLTTGLYRFGTDAPFVQRIPAALAAAPNVTLLTRATVLELVAGAEGSRVVAARVAGSGGAQFEVRASRFVLAAGAIENARLLLTSSGADPQGLGNRHGWVGRCFMEHPRDFSMRLVPARGDWFDALRFYDQHRTADGSTILGRLALREDAMREHALLNASVTLLPAGAPRPGGAPGWRERVVRWLGRAAGWREAGDREVAASGPGPHAASGAQAYPRGGAGWSAGPRPSDAHAFVRLLVNLEQAPHPDNRIVLVDARDRLGARRVQVRWQWRADEQDRLERLRGLLAKELEGAGLGRIERAAQATPDPRAHHHAGTTRMHDDPRFGVVDRECRVHGTENLFVAGASVFPTAGFANPTLTIVALALRLAQRLGSPG
jgi:choline dehydrogenase-like flavoprotein